MNKFLDGSKNQLLIKLVFSWVNNEFYFPIFPKTYPLSSNYCNIIHFDLMVTCNKISSGLEAADAERRRGRRDVGGGRRPVGHRQRRRRRQGDDHRRILHRRRRSGGSPSFPLLWFVFFCPDFRIVLLSNLFHFQHEKNCSPRCNKTRIGSNGSSLMTF